jgi:hypothetical protein
MTKVERFNPHLTTVFKCLVLYRHLDSLFRGAAYMERKMTGINEACNHTIVLHDIGRSPTHQQHLLAPFRRQHRSLGHVTITGQVELAVAEETVSEVKQIRYQSTVQVFEELKELAALATTHLEHKDLRMCNEITKDVCNWLRYLRMDPIWRKHKTNALFQEELGNAAFNLFMTLGTNLLRVAEEAAGDLTLVCRYAGWAVGVFGSYRWYSPRGPTWVPNTLHWGRVLLGNAKACRLMNQQSDANELVIKAEWAVREHATAKFELRPEIEAERQAIEAMTHRKPRTP